MVNGKDKKILFLGTQMALAGAQNVLLTQAQWFHKHGYEVTAAFLYDDQNLNEEWSEKYGFEVLDFNAWVKGKNIISNSWKLILGIYNLYKFLQKGNYDVIETFTSDCNLIGIPLAYLAGIPKRIPTLHGMLYDRPYLLFWLHGKLVNSKMSSQLVVVSNRVRDSAITIEKIKIEKIKVILNGILINKLEFNRSQARKKLGWPEDDLILLNVGRLTKAKGQNFIIEAMPKIITKFPKAVAYIAGEGELRGALENKIKAIDLKDRIKLLGVRKEIDLMQQAADLFVMPSLWEGLPVALLEAMAMETAALVSDVEGINDVILNGENGVVVPIADVEAFSDAVIDLLGDSERRKKMGVAARKYVLANFSEEMMCQQYEKAFFGEKY